METKHLYWICQRGSIHRPDCHGALRDATTGGKAASPVVREKKTGHVNAVMEHVGRHGALVILPSVGDFLEKSRHNERQEFRIGSNSNCSSVQTLKVRQCFGRCRIG